MISVRILLAALLPLALCLTPEELTQLALHELSAQETTALSRPREDKEVYASFLTNLTAFAKQELAVAKEASVFLKQFQGCDNGTTEEFLSKYYSAEQIFQIKNSFKRITFRVNFIEDNGNQMVRFTRYGKDVLPPRKLATLKDVKETKQVETASIVIESLELVLDVVGVKFKLDAYEEKEVIDKATEWVEANEEIQLAVDDLIASPPEDRPQKIYKLIQAINGSGLFWKLVKLICKNMSAFDWAISSVKIAVTIVAVLVTDGAALILKIGLALVDATQFIVKLSTMAYLNTLQQTFECQQN